MIQIETALLSSTSCSLPDKSTSLSEVPMRRRRNGAHGLAPKPRPGRSQHPQVNRRPSVPRPTQPTRPASLLWRAEVPPRNAPGNRDFWAEQGRAVRPGMLWGPPPIPPLRVLTSDRSTWGNSPTHALLGTQTPSSGKRDPEGPCRTWQVSVTNGISRTYSCWDCLQVWESGVVHGRSVWNTAHLRVSI